MLDDENWLNILKKSRGVHFKKFEVPFFYIMLERVDRIVQLRRSIFHFIFKAYKASFDNKVI